jgi:hypothetical protein
MSISPSLSYLTLAAALLATEAPAQQPKPSQGGRVIAIDVLLLPDATMDARAKAVNAKLRENYPQGYTLGKDQTPHITLVHRYVHEKDLPAIETDVVKLAASEKPRAWTLTATGLENGVWAGVAITTIAVTPTPEMTRLQAAVVKAVEPYAVTGGTAAAFSLSRELPKIDRDIVDYVENFVRNSSGPKFNPHVTVGVAHEDFVKKLEAAPFESFSFRPAGVAIYQLGNFGTAQKKLWEWKSKSTANGEDP